MMSIIDKEIKTYNCIQFHVVFGKLGKKGERKKKEGVEEMKRKLAENREFEAYLDCFLTCPRFSSRNSAYQCCRHENMSIDPIFPSIIAQRTLEDPFLVFFELFLARQCDFSFLG